MKGFIVNGVKNLNYLKILKITIGCVLAMYFAYLLEQVLYCLRNYYNFNDPRHKKETLSSALKSYLICIITINCIYCI